MMKAIRLWSRRILGVLSAGLFMENWFRMIYEFIINPVFNPESQIMLIWCAFGLSFFAMMEWAFPSSRGDTV